MSVKFKTDQTRPQSILRTRAAQNLSDQELPPPTAETTKETSSVPAEKQPSPPSIAAPPLRSSPSYTDTAIGKYVNWNGYQHATLADHSWCCIADLIAFCDKYEYKTLSLSDARAHATIVAEVQALLHGGQAPFDMRRRFPANICNPENLWVCIQRCPSVEYHLGRMLNVFRRPLEKLTTDKQRIARQNFHLAVNELRLDISARISEVRLYDRAIFENEFQLKWMDLLTG